MPRRMDSSLHGVACAVAQAVGVLPLALFPCFAMADNYYNPAFYLTTHRPWQIYLALKKQ